MKIKLLKDHLDHTAGDTVEVTTERGGYLVRVGVAEESKDKKHTKELKEPYSKSKEGTKGIVYKKTPEEADAEIKKLNKDL